VPLCILAYSMKSAPGVVVFAIGMATAFLPIYIQVAVAEYLVENGYATPAHALAGRFIGSSTYAFCAFRIIGASVGATPKGADADLSTWITFATAPCDPLYDKESGKPIKPAAGAIGSRVMYILLRLVALSLVTSISHPFQARPATAYAQTLDMGAVGDAVGFVVDFALVQLMMIYLFLSLLLDIGCLLLEAQGFTPLTAFANPIFDTRSPRDFWGKKWNLQVTATLKRCVFIPMRKLLGVPSSVAAIATFLFSGLFHEYQFILSFPNYKLGAISYFFGMQALFAFGETIYTSVLGKTGVSSVFGVPYWVQSLVIIFIFSPTIPYFSNIWLDEGMFDVMSAMTPQIKLQ